VKHETNYISLKDTKKLKDRNIRMIEFEKCHYDHNLLKQTTKINHKLNNEMKIHGSNYEMIEMTIKLIKINLIFYQHN